MKQILSESVEKKYAVGAFDAMDHSMVEGILAAAEEKDKPVIIMVVELIYDLPNSRNFMKYIVDRCERSSVPVALLLDHGKTFEGVMKSIHYGCTSVMFDGSSLPFEENVKETRRVVEIAHACGVSVEGEIGHVAGHEGNMLDGNVPDASKYTKVDDAVRYVEETGVDALAIAIGSVHGVYKGEPNLDYDRLREIRAAVSQPLVMHGGSGLRPDDFRNAIANGINKVNFFTGMSLAAGNAMIKTVEERSRNLHFHEIVNAGIKEVSKVVGEQIDVFGTQKLTIG
jgi:fructose-bisphosphate aldolase class II